MAAPIKGFRPSPAASEAKQKMMAALAECPPEVTVEQMLAVAAQVVGNLIALQDQRRMTPADAMALVSANIQEGNRLAIDTMLGETRGCA